MRDALIHILLLLFSEHSSSFLIRLVLWDGVCLVFLHLQWRDLQYQRLIHSHINHTIPLFFFPSHYFECMWLSSSECRSFLLILFHLPSPLLLPSLTSHLIPPSSHSTSPSLHLALHLSKTIGRATFCTDAHYESWGKGQSAVTWVPHLYLVLIQ